MHVVTGGCGFIGSVLVHKLLEQGKEVKIIDVTQPTLKHPNLTFSKKSILENLHEELRGCDVLIHLAAVLGVENSDKHPLKTLEVNLIGSRNVFQAAVDCGVKKVLYASSSEVYGEPRELPIKETTTKGPVSTYGVSKLAAEMYALAHQGEGKTNFYITRFFNVYGPGQLPQWVMSIFIKNVLESKAPKVFGDGSQTRCFTYVDDAVDGILTVLEKGKPGEAYNVGNDKQTTILELAQLTIKASGKKLKLEIVPFGEKTRLKEREINYRQPDNSKMRKLGWKPKVLVEEGLRKTYGWKEKHPVQ